MADTLVQPTLVVGTYEKVLFGFALHLDAPKDRSRFTPLFTAPGHLEPIKSVAANSKFVATGGQDETINVYNIRRKTELGALRQQDGSITALAFCGQHLLSAASDGSLVIWKCKDWSVASILRGHKAGILSLSVHPSQRACISISSDKKLRLWNLQTSKSAFTIVLPAICEEVMWSPSAERFALLSRTAIYVYSAASGEIEVELPQKKPALCMTFVSEKEIAVGSEDFGVHLWQLANKTERVHLKGHESRVRVMRNFTVDMKTYIASAATDGTVLIWDPAQAEPLVRIETNSRVTCIAFTMVPKAAVDAAPAPAAAPQKRKGKEEEKGPKRSKVELKVASSVENDEDVEDGDDGKGEQEYEQEGDEEEGKGGAEEEQQEGEELSD